MIYNDFSYETYQALVTKLSKDRVNLRFSDFAVANFKIADNYFILRHDIDYSPDSALRMAELEAGMNIQACYFILFSSSFYNLFGDEYINFPKKLVEMGHEVGLHYDVNVYEKLGTVLDKSEILEAQIALLSQLAGKNVVSIAMHNPSVSGMDPFRKVRFVNAYDDEFTKGATYFSDSCGAWRDDFEEHILKDNFPPKIQLLIHPIFWDIQARNRWQTLDDFIANKKSKLSNEASEIITMWSKHSGVIQHERRFVAK